MTRALGRTGSQRRTASLTLASRSVGAHAPSGKAKEAGLDTPGTEGLTEEEKRVLKLLVVGRNGKEIAADLAISPERVREYVQSILAKLQVHSRLEAAARSISSEAHPKGPQDPRYPRCSAMLEQTLTVKELEVRVGDEPRKMRIAYCSRFGSAVGLFA